MDIKSKMFSEIPKSKLVSAVMLTILLEFGKLGGAAGAPADSNTPYAASWKTEDEFKFDQDFGISEDDSSFIRNVITGIIAFVIAVVAICLILCFCCPICILAKMRQRRGVVIRTPAANGQGVTINVNRTAPASTSSPQVVAIPNNFNTSSKPYPVQESVTVVPLLQPQQPMQYPMPMHPQPPPPTNMNYPTGPQYPPQNFELPPPYPGLPRESDTSNLPYNPYFTGDDVTPGAPPPK